MKQGSLGQELKFQVKANIAPSPAAEGKPPLPKYHAYLTLRNNILAEDDEVMRYFPYFGEDAAENDDLAALNLEEAFVDKTKNAQEENMRAESELRPFPIFFFIPSSTSNAQQFWDFYGTYQFEASLDGSTHNQSAGWSCWLYHVLRTLPRK